METAVKVALEKPAPVKESKPIPTPALLLTMLKAAAKVSDLIMSPGSYPVVEQSGKLVPIKIAGMAPLTAEDTRRIGYELIGGNKQAIEALEQLGSCDVSYRVPGHSRFRVNIFQQRGTHAIVMRVIPPVIPTFDQLHLPPQLGEITNLLNGIVLVTGPTGSGKSSTLAAIIDRINDTHAYHILTIEDPIEFVHPCKKGHVNQREVGPHTQSFANALRASLREAPDVIMIGEMRDLETISLAITAAETGHLVFGTLHTPDAQRTINRVIDVFPPREQGQIRAMFSESLRGIVSQHLLPGLDGKSMHLACEILFNTGAIANIIRENRAFQIHGIMQTHRKQGMCLMDDSLLRLLREKKVSREEVLARADNVGLMEKESAPPPAAVQPAPAQVVGGGHA